MDPIYSRCCGNLVPQGCEPVRDLEPMYIDPGTGSLVVQAIIAAIAGGLLVFRGWWYRLVSLLGKSTETKSPNADR